MIFKIKWNNGIAHACICLQNFMLKWRLLIVIMVNAIIQLILSILQNHLSLLQQATQTVSLVNSNTILVNTGWSKVIRLSSAFTNKCKYLKLIWTLMTFFLIYARIRRWSGSIMKKRELSSRSCSAATSIKPRARKSSRLTRIIADRIRSTTITTNTAT